ncbi:MAG TPA: GGDEF domain-containing protein [Gemmatimonadales bacterium]
MRALVWIERQPKAAVLAAMLLMAGLLGWTDYLTGVEIAFSVFYFLPIAGAAYFVGLRAGMVVAGVSALSWLLADQLGGHAYSSAPIGVWNTLNRLLSFVVLAGLLGALRRAYEDQKELAYSDGLTGARNRRRFLELVDLEIGRARRFRRPFTVVLFDLDGFKAVNDRLGHVEGDAVLRAVVETTRSNLRETDVVARLGGDEFAILLAETDAEAARRAVAKLQGSLAEEMQKHEWPVSCSLGVLTCIDPPVDADDLVRLVDALTYAAKTRGKNTAVFDVVAARLVSLTTASRARSAIPESS